MLTTTSSFLLTAPADDVNTYLNEFDKNKYNEKQSIIDKSEYFSNLNPLAVKIAIDIKEAISPYENLWNQLNINEQIEIVNDIFIKPDISLLYEKKSKISGLSLSSSSKSSSSSSSVTTNSVLSLIQDEYPSCNIKSSVSRNTDIGINNICINTTGISSNSTTTASTTMVTIASNDSTNSGIITLIPNNNTLKSQTLKSISSNPYTFYKELRIKSIYQFDGKNLSTYSKQKTGLKIIKDDVFGSFPDEHSTPFCVKTKSQINLTLFDDKNPGDEVPSAVTILKFQKVNKEIAECVMKNSNEIKLSNNTNSSNSIDNYPSTNYSFDNTLFSVNNTKYERFYNNSNQNNLKNKNFTPLDYLSENCNSNLLWKFISKSNNNSNNCKNFTSISTVDNMTTSQTNNKNNLQYLENDCEFLTNLNDESINLNNSEKSLTNIEIKEKQTSPFCDEDEDRHEIKEDSQLLDNDILRKGFEFLNNW